MAAKAKLVLDVLQKNFSEAQRVTVSPIIKAAGYIGLALLEKFFVDEVFRCPCRTENFVERYNGIEWNALYSSFFFLTPALSLYLLSLAQSKGVWDLFMGICKNKKTRCKTLCCWCCCLQTGEKRRSKGWLIANVEGFFVIVMWFAMALLDGKYGACFLTKKPYTDETCEMVNAKKRDELPYSVEYENNKSTSQIIGGFGILGAALVYFLGVCFVRCCRDVDFQTFVVVEKYLALKEKTIEEDIKKILEKKLRKVLPKLEERKYFEEAIKEMRGIEKECKDENHEYVIITEVTPGAGDRQVPASASLTADESAPTGEQVPAGEPVPTGAPEPSE